MTIRTTARSLRDAFRCVGSIPDRKLTIPILNSVLIQDGKMTVTDLDMEATVDIATIDTSDDPTAIEFTSFMRLVRLMGADDQVEISQMAETAALSFNGARYDLYRYSADNFPRIGDAVSRGKAKAAWTALDNYGFASALRKVRFAISTEETRYYLNGVSFIERDGRPFMVATDGHKCALCPAPFTIDGAPCAIIPRRAVDFIANQRHEPERIRFDRDSDKMYVEWPGLSLVTKLIDGTYPDIWRVYPADTVPYFTAKKADIIPSLRRISAVRGGRTPSAMISISDGAIIVSSVRDGGLKAQERVSATINVDLPRDDFGFNADYLIDACRAVSGDMVDFRGHENGAEAPTSPWLISSPDATDGVEVIQMPVRV